MTAALRKRSVLLACVFLALAALAWWYFGAGKTEPAVKPTVIPVGIETVQLRDVPQSTSGIGSVQSLHTVTLRSQAEGVLAEVLFREGQMVKRGDLLARIDDREYAAALMQAEAELASNQAQLKSAELDQVRYGNLLKEEAVSVQIVEQQTATVERLRAAVRSSEAAVATARVQLSYTRIVSPIDGRVGLRRVDAGNLIRANDAEGLVTVTQITPISVIFSLPQELLPTLRPLLEGAAAPVKAYTREAGTQLAEGRLATVDNQVDPTTGMVRLRADFANTDGSLWPGQFVTVQLLTGQFPKALVVPVRSVRHGLNGAYVFRVKDGKAEVVPVKTSFQDDSIVVVTEGLAQGDRIVIDGYSRIKAGSQVREVEAAVNKAAD
ncbi:MULTISPECIES: efflux RND transporter periplasmic adaptor subunit [Hydrocarboniphaga]|uniref:Resistance-Nodulation-Cell Division (RND) efflux membrane fusion protein n=1 Tax=Hydrocarboniphaga effusa AP103 TaxID=1172194 RepID=I8T2V8_9GAMM|nr:MULTISPECIES: efflux RND transporter periplasmic adaptor subunit [Hydrocarboniphaga]EIT68008.1 Resistance-Nodulation-Cell Division (RND) efflux membrane fusion protein precursor [Hydrocarboniphaga effusa AP103]MDZ4080140.1 efflux RND transporter periplasmic adaptor subunit [Hydrocarboniphaga sp.]